MKDRVSKLLAKLDSILGDNKSNERVKIIFELYLSTGLLLHNILPKEFLSETSDFMSQNKTDPYVVRIIQNAQTYPEMGFDELLDFSRYKPPHPPPSPQHYTNLVIKPVSSV